jgi:ABC-type antimicrobial peptide transport system, permease component
MFKNYFKIAFRNLRKNKVYAGINIIGLAIGIASCLLLYLILQFETSFDNFHAKGNHIYRVCTVFHNGDGISYSSGIALPAANGLRIDFPELKEVASIYRLGEGQITIDDANNKDQKKLTEENVFYAEPQFFNMFTFGWLAGSPATSLKDPNQVALTQTTAEKYFGNWKDAIGKPITLDNKYTYVVSGILKNVPVNSDFPLSVVVSYATIKNTGMKRNLDDWVSTFSSNNTYVILPDHYSVDKFNAALVQFAKKHKPADYAQDSYVLQPLKEIHYDSKLSNFRGHTFSHSLITALILIALFLVLIACVNYVNLSTAQALNRTREVGIRKVLGSIRKQLTIQFLIETAIITFVSIALAVMIAKLSLPYLNQLLETDIQFNILSNPISVALLIGLFVIVTLLSGLYPAIVLSGFSPIAALKSKITNQEVGGVSLRRILVVIQFAIAHVLVIAMLIVMSQMNYVHKASLGFDKDEILNVRIPSDSADHEKIGYLRNQLLENPDIKKLSFSMASPSSDGNWNSDFKFENNPKNTDFSANLKWADADYFNTYNLQFVAGRPYNPSDTVREFVVNETLVNKLGLKSPNDIIGKQLNFWDGGVKGPVVGVIRNFNSYSLRQPMAPVVLSTWKSVYQTINIKMKAGSEKNVIAAVQNAWTKAFPAYVFQYQFLDKTIDNFYKQENQLSILYKIFGAIALIISCLGLYGLVSFMTIQRTKEVGIRKVLGASFGNIVYLLTKEFTVLVLIAFVIAAPLAYYVMHKWLENFSYRINMTIGIFLIGIAGIIIVSWITAGYRTIRTAISNPVKSLRSE